MLAMGKTGVATLGLAMLALGSCATPQQTGGEQSGDGSRTAAIAPPVTQADIAALRAEIASLRAELRNVSQQASNAAARAEAAARSAQNAASKAAASVSKSNKIYSQSLQK